MPLIKNMFDVLCGLLQFLFYCTGFMEEQINRWCVEFYAKRNNHLNGDLFAFVYAKDMVASVLSRCHFNEFISSDY